jgi:hypothetical protein
MIELLCKSRQFKATNPKLELMHFASFGKAVLVLL